MACTYVRRGHCLLSADRSLFARSLARPLLCFFFFLSLVSQGRELLLRLALDGTTTFPGVVCPSSLALRCSSGDEPSHRATHPHPHYCQGSLQTAAHCIRPHIPSSASGAGGFNWLRIRRRTHAALGTPCRTLANHVVRNCARITGSPSASGCTLILLVLQFALALRLRLRRRLPFSLLSSVRSRLVLFCSARLGREAKRK